MQAGCKLAWRLPGYFQVSSKTAIRGFEATKLTTNERVEELLRGVPSAHVNNLKAIAFVGREQYSLYDLPSAGEQGAYFPDYRSILIFSATDRDACEHVIFHELGHLVFHQVLTSYQRKTWTTQLWTLRKFVSDYARTDPAEDFAESYAFCVLNPARIKTIAEKYHFLRFTVFAV